MLHLIGKNLWARRYRNGWLLAELIIVSMVIWIPLPKSLKFSMA